MKFFGIKLVKDRLLILELSRTFGLGLKTSKYLIGKLGFSNRVRVEALTDVHLRFLTRFVRLYHLVGSDLRRYLVNCRKQKVFLKNYQGLRFIQHLPVRGQKTKTNAEVASKLNRI